MSIKQAGFLLLLLVMTGCGATANPAGVPRLVEDVTLPPVTLTATRQPTNTPEGFVAPTDVAAVMSPTPAFTSEVMSPIQVVTVQADFIIVTPTLPPSKTPTATPTITTTPTISPTPSLTATATTTAPSFPTSVINPTTAPVVNPIPQVCDTLWGFIQPPPRSCPFTRPTAMPGVYQSFRTAPDSPQGFMIWVDHFPHSENVTDGDEIYILFNDGTWTSRLDYFIEDNSQPPPAGSPYKDLSIDNTRPPWGYQPVRGFGFVWRQEFYNQPFNRIGWADIPDEQVYSSLKFYREENVPDPTVFISRPNGDVFALFSSGRWQLYSQYSFPPPMQPTASSGLQPLPTVNP